MQEKIAVIGVGNMASAILNGVLMSNIISSGDVLLYDIDMNKTSSFMSQGCVIAESATETVNSAKYVLLSVKPQVLGGVLESIKKSIKPSHVLISICAGISAQFIKDIIGVECGIITAMPNTPLLLGRGATAISKASEICDKDFEFVKSLFLSAGKAYEISADKMNEVIPINGSSPAYIYYFAKIFVEEAIANGFDKETANNLFCDTLIGAAAMMQKGDKTHDELIKMVTSPGGTTLAGLEELYHGKFEDTLRNCFNATIKRAYELAK